MLAERWHPATRVSVSCQELFKRFRDGCDILTGRDSVGFLSLRCPVYKVRRLYTPELQLVMPLLVYRSGTVNQFVIGALFPLPRLWFYPIWFRSCDAVHAPFGRWQCGLLRYDA